MTATPEIFRVLPAGAAADGLRRAPLSALLARLPAGYQQLARDALARHPRRSVVVHDGEQWLSRWDARWLGSWVAAALRVEAREIVQLLDADGETR